MTKLKIKVTKEILERSKMCGTGESTFKGNSCAIALAVRDIFPNADVGVGHIKFDNRINTDVWNFAYLDPATRLYIQYFDMTEPLLRPQIAEYEFEIVIPESIIEKINIEELKPLLENHPTLQLIEN